MRKKVGWIARIAQHRWKSGEKSSQHYWNWMLNRLKRTTTRSGEKSCSQKAKIIAGIIEWIQIKRMISHSLLNLSSFKPDLQLEAHTIFAIDGKNERHQLPHMSLHTGTCHQMPFKRDCLTFVVFRFDSVCMLTRVGVCGITWYILWNVAKKGTQNRPLELILIEFNDSMTFVNGVSRGINVANNKFNRRWSEVALWPI